MTGSSCFAWAGEGAGIQTKTQKLADGSSAKKNFNIYYELDGEEVGTALRADEYGGDEDFSWVMLEPEAAAAEA